MVEEGPLDVVAAVLDRAFCGRSSCGFSNLVRPARLFLFLYLSSVLLEIYSRYCLGLPLLSQSNWVVEEEAVTVDTQGEREAEHVQLDCSSGLEFASLSDALKASESASKEFDFVAAGRALASADAIAERSDRNRYEHAKW